MLAFASGHSQARMWCPPVLLQGQWPQLLSQTRVYVNREQTVLTPNFFHYNVKVPLWSDDAQKNRSICIPGQTTLPNPIPEAADLPDGTVIVKDFQFSERIETRFLIKVSGEWQMKAYRWNGRDGTRVDDFETATLNIQGRPTWDFMSSANCKSCHFDRGQMRPLGWTAMQFASSAVSYPSLLDTRASLYSRARAYLAVNCATCHWPGGLGRGEMDLRFETPLLEMNVVGRIPYVSNVGVPDSKIIYPGVKEKSVIWLRLSQTTSIHMPPLGSHQADPLGTSILGQWIDSGATETSSIPTLNKETRP